MAERNPAAAFEFFDNQKVFNTQTTLAELAEMIQAQDPGALAGYVFAWSDYVYDIGEVLDSPAALRTAIARRAQSTEFLDLSTKVSALTKLVRDTSVDELAGYIYTEDKKTFIVGAIPEDMEVTTPTIPS